jgi:TolB-like protein/Tfp pilus assembly protein PilF
MNRIATSSADSEKVACPRCGSISRLQTGVCVSCLLGEGLEAGDEVSRAVFENVVAEVDVPDRQWRLGDYEILDEIGRGGMGVIYLARQRHPNRIVAVKRVLDHHAGLHQTVKRFRREADAAASLDHPNILPIYEVSESEDGLPFFSMKYATGGSLQKVGPTLRTDARRCVQLMAKVARGVEHAHGQGILHRDLKPGNILLDGRGEPLVSDFGLAKFLDPNKDITKSLTTFGTPGYTAPEQAEGKGADLTPAADVYSLGAILFELLAGRPPFVGDNALGVIRQAAETPAPKLRSLAHSYDRDLETICVRCLERDPKARYQSAGDLATDLERWLDGRPIIARPISVPTRVGRWSRRNPKLIATGAACLLFGAATMWFFRGELTRVLPAVPEKSIAVLPLENLSGDPDNAYFADGIQEEILTRLAGIADLKVISRTSTQRYQSKPRNLPEIAKQLGAGNILEGSVQKTADQVRVNVQLINAQTDSHIWAETYDRKLTDILGVESEIAKAIAESLQAKLTGREEQVIAAKSTENIEAYDAYLRGLAYMLKPGANTPAYYLGAQKYLREAVRLDPKFALAWARLSYADALGYITTNLQPTDVLREEIRQAAETALTLQPNLGEALHAKGFYYYACLKDYNNAVHYFEQARRLLPNNSAIPRSLAYVARRRGQWDQSESYFKEAERLDPRNVSLLTQHAYSDVNLRRFGEALRKLDQVLNITPDDVDTIAFKAAIAQSQGDLPRAAALLAPLHPNPADYSALEVQAYQAILERRPAQIISRLKEILAKPDPGLGFYNGELCFWLGWAQEVAGDHAAAHQTWQQARSELERFLKEQPQNRRLVEHLALTNVVLGDKVAALTLSERATAANPIQKDAVSGAAPIEVLARVAAQTGDPDRAVAALQKLFSVPGEGALAQNIPLTPALLRLDPMFDALRSDPRFQELCKEKIDKSIAVLPFENLSSDPDNAYFADGIQEEILTRLAKIADLKVISRTSTQQYQSKPRNLAEIAKQLGVANIIEGSVQKAADKIRVNVQLINAETDSHLWAESYDRKLTDIFGVESEIAKRIAESLQARLSGSEEQALAVKPTNNPDAYDAYLRGQVLEARSNYSIDLIWKAVSFYERAVQLDPNFALAWARLSRADALLYFRQDTIADRRDAAKKAFENAEKLQPNSAETLLALGYYQYWVLRDYGLAKATFGLASKILPGSSEVPFALGLVTQREGNWDEGVAYLEQGLTLDPRNWALLEDTAGVYAMIRQFPAALKLYDRALDIIPNDPDLMAFKAGSYQAQGNLVRAAKLLSATGADTPSWGAFTIKITQLRLERNYAEAIRLLETRLARFHFASELDRAADKLYLAFTQYWAGDGLGAKVTAEQARITLEALSQNQSDSARIAALLSLSYAALGNEDAALKEAQHAITLSSKDRVFGPAREENLALIQAIFGDSSRAISTLTRLLETPYAGWLYPSTPITPALLRLDPFWDPLRVDPAFQKLCEQKQPPATP